MKFKFNKWPERWRDYPKRLHATYEVTDRHWDSWWALRNPPHQGAFLSEEDDIEVVDQPQPDLSARLHDVTKDRDALRASLAEFTDDFLGATGEAYDPKRDYREKPLAVKSQRLGFTNGWAVFKNAANPGWSAYHRDDPSQKIDAQDFEDLMDRINNRSGHLGEWRGWKAYEHKDARKPRFGAYKDGRTAIKSDDFKWVMNRILKAEAPPATSEFTWNGWEVSRDPQKVHGLKAYKDGQTFWRKDMAALLDAMTEYDNGGDGTTAKEYRKRWHDVSEAFRQVVGEEFDAKKDYSAAQERIRELEKLANQPVAKRQIHSVDGKHCVYLGPQGHQVQAFVHPEDPVVPGQMAFVWYHTHEQKSWRVAQNSPDFRPLARSYLELDDEPEEGPRVAKVTSRGNASSSDTCWAKTPTETVFVTGVPADIVKGDEILIKATQGRRMLSQEMRWQFFGVFKRKETPMSDPAKVGLLMRGLKSSPKYLVFFVLFSVLSSPIENYNSAKEFLTAPSALETGEWTRVTACDGCDKVADAENAETLTVTGFVCPDCGGEAFSDRKAKKLMQDSLWPWSDATVRGYQFDDGDVTVDPGTEFPEGGSP
jgi:hypothetical protein